MLSWNVPRAFQPSQTSFPASSHSGMVTGQGRGQSLWSCLQILVWSVPCLTKVCPLTALVPGRATQGP